MKTLIIDGLSTDYNINEQGQIFSNKTHKILTGTIMNTGYRMVRLTTEAGKKGYAVHRLVAETFIPNPDGLPIVNHKDGNKLNNAVSNLEWVSAAENRQHAIDTNITKLATGTRLQLSLDELDLENEWKEYQDTGYLISKSGEVFNMKTHILLKQTPNKSGYIRYTLRINGVNKSKLGHLLVMETWGQRKILPNEVVNHINGDKTDNRIENLEIISKSENALHSCYVLHNNVKAVIQHCTTGDKEYPSISYAARELHITDGAIRYALKNHSKCCGCYWSYK